jgi:ribosomal protein S18 acetylase RimI-like enzyme
MDGEHGEPDIVIRNLSRDDLAALVRIDRQITGRSRQTWYAGKLERALVASDVQISLGAERDGMLVGAMLGSLHYGEFGQPEPLAVLDTVLVDREFGRQGVATALMEQLVKNLRALRIERLRTEVAWDDHELVAFFSRKGFAPVPRLVLEADLAKLEEDHG